MVEVSLSDLMSQPQKHYMRLFLKTVELDGRSLRTVFGGFVLSKEQIFRIVRKRTDKLEVVNTVQTKDNWTIQVTTIAVLNRNAETSVQKKIRNEVDRFIKDRASNSTMDEFVKLVINNIFQVGIKKTCSKIYPVRFSEIAKIEVVKAGV